MAKREQIVADLKQGLSRATDPVVMLQLSCLVTALCEGADRKPLKELLAAKYDDEYLADPINRWMGKHHSVRMVDVDREKTLAAIEAVKPARPQPAGPVVS